MWKTAEGSTGRLIQLCLGYFFSYVVTGVTVKYFLGSAAKGLPGMSGMEFLFYSTLGGTSVCLTVVLVLRWFRMKSNRYVDWHGLSLPYELIYIIPSGVCTAVIIPTTTLMYTLPISVMVAMVIMRASVIITSRIIDTIQINQGILRKEVYWQENAGVAFALLAIATKLGWDLMTKGPGQFNFLTDAMAMTIFSAYIVSYAIRIYIMNYFKNTRAKGVKQDNKGFFALEQITASSTILIVALLLLASPSIFGWSPDQVPQQISQWNGAILDPLPMWGWAVLAGGAFGVAAFFSVFLFMFKGRTATFAGLVNRLTSLIAGTTATVIFWKVFGGRFPKPQDWTSLFFIFVAVGFLTFAERRRTKELLAAHEIHETAEEDEAEEQAVPAKA